MRTNDLRQAALGLGLFALLAGSTQAFQGDSAPRLGPYTQTRLAEGWSIQTGSLASGTLDDLHTSDDQALQVQATQGRSELLLVTTSPSAQPTAIGFLLEGKLLPGSPAAQQTIQLRDFTSGSWVTLQTQQQSPGPDGWTWALENLAPERFVQPGTRRMECLVTHDWAGSSGTPGISLDQALWRVSLPTFDRSLSFQGYPVPSLNTSANWIRTVFDLDASRMAPAPLGVQLTFDVTDPGPYDFTFRAELRETNNQTFPKPGTSQVYRLRFDVAELPDLYGPVTIFQRFNKALNGPDIEVELTGANQFFDAVPGDLQVVAFGRRHRLGKFLQPKNDLAIVIYNAAQGKFRVSLNGETLHGDEGVDTRSTPQGGWAQFGLYPHGLHDPANRADQLASGFSQVSFVVHAFRKIGIPGEVNLDDFPTTDPN